VEPEQKCSTKSSSPAASSKATRRRWPPGAAPAKTSRPFDTTWGAWSRGFAEQDILFHERILLAARNRLLRRASRPLSAVLHSGRLLTQTVPGEMDHSLQGHQTIYAAIAAQDPEGAQAAMLEHLAQFEHDIKLSLLQQPGEAERD